MGLKKLFGAMFKGDLQREPANEKAVKPETGTPEVPGDADVRGPVKYPELVEAMLARHSPATDAELKARLDELLENPSKSCKPERMDFLAEIDAVVSVLCARGVQGLDERLSEAASVSSACGQHCAGGNMAAEFLGQLSRKAGRIAAERDLAISGADSPGKAVAVLAEKMKEKMGNGQSAGVEIEMLTELVEHSKGRMLELAVDREEDAAVRVAALGVLEVAHDSEVQAALLRALEAELEDEAPAVATEFSEHLGRVGDRAAADGIAGLLARSAAEDDLRKQTLIEALGGFYQREVIDSAALKECVGQYADDLCPETAQKAGMVMGLTDYEKFR